MRGVGTMTVYAVSALCSAAIAVVSVSVGTAVLLQAATVSERMLSVGVLGVAGIALLALLVACLLDHLAADG